MRGHGKTSGRLPHHQLEAWIGHFSRWPSDPATEATVGRSAKFKSLTEQHVDSLGIFGDAIVGLLAAMAEQEFLRISERTKAGTGRALNPRQELETQP